MSAPAAPVRAPGIGWAVYRAPTHAMDPMFERNRFAVPGPVVSEYVDEVYTAGDCWLLALNIAWATGLPIAYIAPGNHEVGVHPRTYHWCHVAVQLPNGDYLDVRGVHTGPQLAANWCGGVCTIAVLHHTHPALYDLNPIDGTRYLPATHDAYLQATVQTCISFARSRGAL